MTGVSDNEKDRKAKDRKAVFFALPEFIKRTAKHVKYAKGVFKGEELLNKSLEYNHCRHGPSSTSVKK